MPLILALWGHNQVDLCEFKASLAYKASSRIAKTITQRNRKTNKQTKQKEGKHNRKLKGNILFTLGSFTMMAVVEYYFN